MTVPLGPMIPTMRLRSFVPCVLVLLFGSCMVQEPGPAVPLEEGLRLYGRISAEPVPEGPVGLAHLEVILIRDRHAVHGAITRERGPLQKIQRQNRGAIGFLVRKGFRLLGCEAPLGPLPDDHGPAAAHRAAVRRALAEGDPLHGLTVYQPIRYEEEFRGVMTVLGMEDTKLYQADVERLEKIIELRRVAGRADAPREERTEALRAMLEHMRAISAQVEQRGQAAACNLVEHMLVEGIDRAMLMLGGAHVPGALQTLLAEGVNVRVFECLSYDER